MTATSPKRPNVIRLITAIIVIGILVTALASLNQAMTWKALCILRYLAMVLPLCFIADAVWCHRRMRQSPDESRFLTDMSVDVTCLLPVSTVAYLIATGIIPFKSWPWLLTLTVTLLPVLIAVAHAQLNAQKVSTALTKSALLALVAGLLTWGQVSLAHHLHTWLFVRVLWVVPIPLLALTTALTSVAAIYAVAVLFSAIFFYPLGHFYRRR